MEEVELGGLGEDDDAGPGFIGLNDEDNRFSYLGNGVEVNFFAFKFIYSGTFFFCFCCWSQVELTVLIVCIN